MNQILESMLIVISVLAVAILFGIRLWRKRSLQNSGEPMKSTFSLEEGTDADILPSDVVAQAQELLTRSKKIEAIKLVKSYTDWNLQEAKDYVETLGNISQVKPVLEGQSVSNVGRNLPSSVMAEVRALLSERKTIAAVRLVRSHTGWDLKESKEFVDSLR